jgi:hypothetical protein
MAKKHMKKCSTCTAIKEMQIKIRLSVHFIPVRMATIKNTTDNKYWGGCGERGALIYYWWNVNYYNHYGKQYGIFLKI